MRGSPRLRCISAAFAWLVLAAAPVAAERAPASEPADSRLTSYRETVERGTAAFVARRFAEARQAFDEAFAIHPDPVLVFNIASCWRRDGDTEQALVEYRRFLTLAPTNDARRMLAEETIAALEAEAAPAPTPAPALEMQLADPPRRTRSVWRPIGLATTGVGAASVIVGIVELVRARSLTTQSSTTAASTWDGEWDGQRDGDGNGDGTWDGNGDGKWDGNGDGNGDGGGRQQDGSDPSDSARKRALVFGAAGVATMAAGVTMYVLGRRSERALNISASASSSGGQLVLGGRF